MNGLYIGSMGMINYIQHLNVHANNIANAQTTGFKADAMTSKVFETEKTYRSDTNGRRMIGVVGHAVIPEATHVNLVQGSMKITNSSTDFYLEDVPGQTSFFVIESNGQRFLTRNGEFSVNDDGYLKTTAGAYVLDVNNNRIQLPRDTDFAVNAQGSLINRKTGAVFAMLQTKGIDEQTAVKLEKHENESFIVKDTDIAGLPNGSAKVYNYMLENSNVDMTKEMAALMTNQKMVQASQRMMMTFDKVYEKEATELLK
ncbi:MAG: flagellar hook-basal body complex protein [Ectobacillus sp.]